MIEEDLANYATLALSFAIQRLNRTVWVREQDKRCPSRYVRLCSLSVFAVIIVNHCMTCSESALTLEFSDRRASSDIILYASDLHLESTLEPAIPKVFEQSSSSSKNIGR